MQMMGCAAAGVPQHPQQASVHVRVNIKFPVVLRLHT
eukprot:SAG25_NODE_11018_length_316_cov_0.718894_1_plen_36_part_10